MAFFLVLSGCVECVCRQFLTEQEEKSKTAKMYRTCFFFVVDPKRTNRPGSRAEHTVGLHICMHIYKVNPFKTAVSFWGQSTQILSKLSPKRASSPIRVKVPL